LSAEAVSSRRRRPRGLLLQNQLSVSGEDQAVYLPFVIDQQLAPAGEQFVGSHDVCGDALAGSRRLSFVAAFIFGGHRLSLVWKAVCGGPGVVDEQQSLSTQTFYCIRQLLSSAAGEFFSSAARRCGYCLSKK